MLSLAVVAGLALAVAAPGPAHGQDPQLPVSTPAACGPGSAPESGIQGRVSLADHESGRADEPYTCNTELVGSIASGGGYKVWRYVDDTGNECAYYDSTLVFPFDAIDPRRESAGVFVVDLADPSAPEVVDRLVTPAMLSPHESLVLNQERGLLAAVMGNPTTYPGIVDIYDVTEDCRSPQLLASAPVGFLGHESGFSPDGMTLYAASLFSSTIAAIDVSDPRSPHLLTILPYSSHGLTLNAAGDRAYLASLYGVGPSGDDSGLTILDVTAIRDRDPLPGAEVVSTLTWPEASIPQVALPVTIDGTDYLFEVDEFAGHPFPAGGLDPSATVGAARIIDISDETAPEVVSNVRLEVHEPEARAGESRNDPGAAFSGRGYAAHYCAVPQPVDPGIVACSMIVSGLRVFDVSDPTAPREIAYFNHPGEPVPVDPFDQEHGAAYAMSAPAFAPERGEIWYSDVASGFHVVRLTNGVWGAATAPDPAADGGGDGEEVAGAEDVGHEGTDAEPVGAGTEARQPATRFVVVPARSPLPVTGGPWGVGALVVAAALGAGTLGRRRGA
ncbi:LVIVD repeat-containing protein [Nitriliruptor alkaliphilus]|uniref:LVIVD repeat-containing protein n=1 Tax=Nitriliruptor alkaliphilus TaxID=427918 RepID=UPI0012EEC10D|nr:hypothetical protein [Nitriliruptor alkaliphilus]